MTIRIKPAETIITQDAILRQKCRTALRNHRAAAKKDGIELNYDAESLYCLALEHQTCEYCRMPLGWVFEFDHRYPLARSSKGHTLANLAVVCVGCNQAKGMLSATEYLSLLAWFSVIDPRGATDVRRRLLAGGEVYARGRKRKS